MTLLYAAVTYSALTIDFFIILWYYLNTIPSREEVPLKKTTELIVAGVLVSGTVGAGTSWATYDHFDSQPASIFIGISVAVFVGIGLVAFGEHHYNKKYAKR